MLTKKRNWCCCLVSVVIHVHGSIPISNLFFQILSFQQKSKVKTIEIIGSSALTVLNRALISINPRIMALINDRKQKNILNRLTLKTGRVTDFNRVTSVLSDSITRWSDKQLEPVILSVHDSTGQTGPSFKTMNITFLF